VGGAVLAGAAGDVHQQLLPHEALPLSVEQEPESDGPCEELVSGMSMKAMVFW
jgi:hypothetical protein